MSQPAPSPTQVLHLSGRDEPGILADLLALTHAHQAPLQELHQSSVEGSLVLTLVLQIPHSSSLLTELRSYAEKKNFHFELRASEPPALTEPPCGICVTLLGELGTGQALAQVTQLLAARELTIRHTRSLGHEPVRGVELSAIKRGGGRFPDAELRELRAALLALGPELSMDWGVQRDDFYRRSKRLLCMDVDSTFVKGEFIDELAELVGVKPQVEAITARAMRGELDFDAALRERVALLRGLPMSRAQQLCDHFELTPGAEELVRTAKQLGLRVGLVSGGFDFFVEMLKKRFGLDFAFANQLEVEDGVLTGRVVGAIVNSQRKAQLLRDMAHVYGIQLEQTIAVGDGANDISMLQTAGLGIAYQAKPRLQEVADTCFNHQERLDALLYLLGYDALEVTSACS